MYCGFCRISTVSDTVREPCTYSFGVALLALQGSLFGGFGQRIFLTWPGDQRGIAQLRVGIDNTLLVRLSKHVPLGYETMFGEILPAKAEQKKRPTLRTDPGQKRVHSGPLVPQFILGMVIGTQKSLGGILDGANNAGLKRPGRRLPVDGAAGQMVLMLDLLLQLEVHKVVGDPWIISGRVG